MPDRPLSTPNRTLHMIGNAHLDPVWQWTWQEGYQEARATFRSALDRMDEYPDFIFTCNQIVLLSWVEEQDPGMFEEIRRREQEGRWVNVGGWWVEPDCNMPMGESFVRQGLYGQRFLQSRFGRAARTGMNADPFGHHVAIPQILRGHGIDSYLFLRPGKHESEQLADVFRWRSPDGSEVLAARIPFEYTCHGGDVSLHTEKSLAQTADRGPDLLVFYGVGNHGGGPTRANIDSIHRYDAMGTFGRLQMSSPDAFIDAVRARGEGHLEALPVHTEDLQHHAPGCYSAHSGIKSWQQRAQHILLAAERWASVAAVECGLDYPREQLEHAWKQVLFNQFHDILPGSSIEDAYEDARDQLGEANAIARRILARAHSELAQRVDIPFEEGTQPVLVFNPHPWPVTTTVELNYENQPLGVLVVDSDGHTLEHQPTQTRAANDNPGRGAVVFRTSVPGLGYRLVRLRPAEQGSRPTPPAGSAELVLENERVRIVLDPDLGWLTSYRLKDESVDVVHGGDPGLHVQVAEDDTDTWGHRVRSYVTSAESMPVHRVVVRERGPVRTRIRVERRWRSSTLAEDLILERGSDSLEVRAELDWREPGHLLKLRIPTSIQDATATWGAPFAELPRPIDGAEQPAQGWVDVTGTVAGHAAGLMMVVTDKHGMDVCPHDAGPSIGVTVARSPVYSWHDPRVLDPEGVYSHHDQGRQRFRYLVVPHHGDHRRVEPARRLAVLARPVRAMVESAHHGDLPPAAGYADDHGDVQITAVKCTEDQPADREGYVVRAVETRGEDTNAVLTVGRAGACVRAEFTPYQLRTWLVPADGSPPVELTLLEQTTKGHQ